MIPIDRQKGTADQLQGGAESFAHYEDIGADDLRSGIIEVRLRRHLRVHS